MEKVLHIQKLLLRSTRLPWLILGVSLGTLAGIILLASLQLREKIREQIAGRDGEILHAVAMMEQMNEEVDPKLLGSIAEPGNQLLVILKTSRLKGVLAARRFDAAGRFAEVFPLHVREGRLAAEDLEMLRRLKPVSHFYPAVAMSQIFYPEQTSGPGESVAAPLLEVNVPLHAGTGPPLVGIAQFLISGEGIAREFAQLDRHLLWQGLAAFLAGGAIVVATVFWAFRKLRRAHKLLADRTNNLLRANQELALAAKTSALGAVTAHLIHGLKNPLSGLQSYVSSLGGIDGGRFEADWQEAVASTRRMQNLINEVVSVLREEEGTSQYEITIAELAEIVTGRLEGLRRETGAKLVTHLETEASLSSRAANLLLLILLNLLQNACEATRGKTVQLSVCRMDGDIVFEVGDEGAGIPEKVAQNLFQPCRSTKEGGSGLGLAISKQLANHLGARLDLKSTGSAGTVFALRLPASCGIEKAAPALPVPR